MSEYVVIKRYKDKRKNPKFIVVKGNFWMEPNPFPNIKEKLKKSGLKDVGEFVIAEFTIGRVDVWIVSGGIPHDWGACVISRMFRPVFLSKPELHILYKEFIKRNEFIGINIKKSKKGGLK